MRYGSICSGIGSEHVAWEGLGWDCCFFSEVDKFASSVLSYRYPGIENIGDFTKDGKKREIDLLIGGTPCQSFSVAGRREGMDDSRGRLAIEYIRFIERNRPRWVVWENVVGVLSSGKGRDFKRFLGALAKVGYFFGWRVLDARYFGVPQQRRRVFLVGYFGDWRPSAAVLFEPESGGRDIEKSKEKGGEDTGRIRTDVELSCFGRGSRKLEIAPPLTTRSVRSLTFASSMFVSESRVHSVSENQRSEIRLTEKVQNLNSGDGKMGQSYGAIFYSDSKGTSKIRKIRKITPLECERLQGLPDNYTRIPWRGKDENNCPDTPRYKAIGNGFAVPVIAWLGRRIDFVEGFIQERRKL